MKRLDDDIPMQDETPPVWAIVACSYAGFLIVLVLSAIVYRLWTGEGV